MEPSRAGSLNRLMHVRRVLAALSVLSILLSAGSAAIAQVEEAEDRAEAAKRSVDSAYQIVSESVADRDQVEAELFLTLDDYGDAANALDAANRDLERVTRTLALADASAVNIEASFEAQAVAAYVEAVASSTASVLDTDSVEDALMLGEVFRAGQRDALDRLDEILVQRAELSRIRARYDADRNAVEELKNRLEADAQRLEQLFAVADARVAAAYRAALEAGQAYRAALDEVGQAKAEEERRRREEAARRAAATTTTTATTPPAPGQPTTTTTTTPRERPALYAAVEAWRPLVAAHFAADLVEDAMYIMQCESLGDPEAVNPYSGASGLFQFMPGTWAVASVKAGVDDRSVFDGEANIIAASWLAEYYRSRGLDPWRPWTCRYYL